MQRGKLIVGALTLAALAVIAFSAYQVACYEAGACPGSRWTYTTYTVMALVALYVLALLHAVSAKLLRPRRA